MDNQVLINMLIGLSATFGGFYLNKIWEAVKDLQNGEKVLSTKMSALEVLIVGNYVTRPEHMNTLEAIFKKLDRIEDKLDHKADKS